LIGRGDLDQLSDVKCGNAKLFGIAELAEWPWVFIGADDHVFALEGTHARATLDAGPVENEFGDWNSLSRINLLLASRTTLVSKSRFHLFLFQTLLLFLPFYVLWSHDATVVIHGEFNWVEVPLIATVAEEFFVVLAKRSWGQPNRAIDAF